MKPLVLLTNDDGVAAAGIRAMRAALAAVADVIVVAPEAEQSMASHAISFHRPLRVRAVDAGVFAVDGTPADCCYVGMHLRTVLPRRPDVVVSGINMGVNLGQDVFYSGTVAAAREAALTGIPAIATSAPSAADHAPIAQATAWFAVELARTPTKPTPLLNLNFPHPWKGKLVPTRLGQRHYDDAVDVRKDPRGREYVWLGGSNVRHDAVPVDGTDTAAFDAGVASVSSLVLDLSEGVYPVAALVARRPA